LNPKNENDRLPKGINSIESLPSPDQCIGLTDNNRCTKAILDWTFENIPNLTPIGFVVEKGYDPKVVAEFMVTLADNHFGHRTEWVDCCISALERHAFLLEFKSNSYLTEDTMNCHNYAFHNIHETPFEVCQLELQTCVRENFESKIIA
jgi:hypothetical protein